jgi:hypothetical protein
LAGWLKPRPALAQPAKGDGEPLAPTRQGQMSEWPIDEGNPESSVPSDEKRALTHDGVTVRDYQRYFTVALAKKGALTGEEVGLLGNVLQHLRDDPGGKDAADELECQLGVRLEDIDRLQRCTAALAARAPDDAKTLSYQWALAMERGNVREAEALLERTRSTAMKPEGLEQMERAIASFQAARRRKMYTWGFGGLAILAGIGVAAIMASRRRRWRAQRRSLLERPRLLAENPLWPGTACGVTRDSPGAAKER